MPSTLPIPTPNKLQSLLRDPALPGLANLYSGTLISGAGWAMVLPITPILASHFNISPGVAAQIITAYALGRFFGIPGAGILIDRFGSRKMLLAGPSLVLAGALAAALTPLFTPILAAAFLIGVGDSLWALGREIAGIDLVTPSRRGRVLSGFHGIHSGALAIGPLAGGLLADNFGFQATFLGFAALSTLALTLGFFAHDTRQPRPQNPTPNQPRLLDLPTRARNLAALFHEIKPALRLTYWALLFATFAGFTFRITLQSILPLYADQQLNLSATQIGTLFSLSGTIVLAMILPAGFVLDKLGRKWGTVPSTLLPGIAFLLVPLAHSYLQLAILVSLMALANGLSLGSLAASSYDILPNHVRGRLQAFRRTAAEIGGVGAPLLGGLLVNTVGPAAPFLAYAPILLLAGLLLAFAARETLTKPGDPTQP